MTKFWQNWSKQIFTVAVYLFPKTIWLSSDHDWLRWPKYFIGTNQHDRPRLNDRLLLYEKTKNSAQHTSNSVEPKNFGLFLAFQIMTLLSSEPVARYIPLVEYLTQLMTLVCTWEISFIILTNPVRSFLTKSVSKSISQNFLTHSKKYSRVTLITWTNSHFIRFWRIEVQRINRLNFIIPSYFRGTPLHYIYYKSFTNYQFLIKK